MKTVWDKIWIKDVYSDEKLRQLKATQKVKKLLQVLPIGEGDKVLDIGCGGGYISKEIYSQTKAKVFALDNSIQAVKLAKIICKNTPIQIVQAKATAIPARDNFVDVVLCIGLLEHVKDIDLALKEIVRVLKDGGYIYVVSSNRFSFMYEQRILRQLIHMWPYGYQKNWTKEKLIKKLNSYGFYTEMAEIQPGIGNFKIIDRLDMIFSTKNRKRGRYIYFIGKLHKGGQI